MIQQCKHLTAAFLVLSLGLSLASTGMAQSRTPPSPKSGDDDVEQLEPLLIEGRIIKFSPAQVMELRTRILAEGLKNPIGCGDDIKQLFVCRFSNPKGSHLKQVRCWSNGDYCSSVGALQTAFLSHSGAGFDFALDKASSGDFASYIERTSYAKVKHQIAALPGKREDNVKYIDALVQGWPPVDERPSIEALQGFAKAYVAIAEIGKRLDPLLQQAKSKADRRAVQRREDAAFGKAIADHGLSADQYNRISEDTQHYFLLKKAVLQFIKQARSGHSSTG